jgi:Zn-dependent M16 (insulinase) family peptidase
MCMIKEPKNIDFYTTGRQPSEHDFAQISDWIRKNKQKQATRKLKSKSAGRKHYKQDSV